MFINTVESFHTPALEDENCIKSTSHLHVSRSFHYTSDGRLTGRGNSLCNDSGISIMKKKISIRASYFDDTND